MRRGVPAVPTGQPPLTLPGRKSKPPSRQGAKLTGGGRRSSQGVVVPPCAHCVLAPWRFSLSHERQVTFQARRPGRRFVRFLDEIQTTRPPGYLVVIGA